MRPILIVFDTRHGQSTRIAERLERRIRELGHEIDVEQNPGARPLLLHELSAVVVVAPIYNRRHTESIERFVLQYGRSLSSKPTAFVSVSMGAASKLRIVRHGVRRIAHRLFDRSGWRPSHEVYVGGSIDYPVYDPTVVRWMRTAAFLFGLPTDTSRRHELTNWDEVVEAADAIVAAAARDAPAPAA